MYHDSMKSEILNDKEMELLKFLVIARSNNEIAEKLAIPYDIVKNRIKVLYSKLKVKNRIQAIIYCINNGILDSYDENNNKKMP